LRSLQKALQSLKAEILVIDNASPDSGWQRLRSKFPEVTWIALPENLGFGKANNIGFSLATGKYLLCLNPDSMVEEHTVQRLVAYMETCSPATTSPIWMNLRMRKWMYSPDRVCCSDARRYATSAASIPSSFSTEKISTFATASSNKDGK